MKKSIKQLKRILVPVFPGGHCHQDTVEALEYVGLEVCVVWHQTRVNAEDYDAAFLSGGFSFGDALRPAAIAAHSVIMHTVQEIAMQGKAVFGVCNGFQLLCESHLLPGVLLENSGGCFISKNIQVKVSAHVIDSPLFRKIEQLHLPIAHHFGRYFYESLSYSSTSFRWPDARIALQYMDAELKISNSINASKNAVAGILGGPSMNILGLMPHPERAISAADGLTNVKTGDGLKLLENFARSIDKEVHIKGVDEH